MFSGEANGLKPHGTTLAIHIRGALFGSVARCYKKSPKNRVTSVKEKTQQQRQRERRQTKSLMSRTIVARMRYHC